MGSWQRWDNFSKSVEGIEVKTRTGGIITLICGCIVTLLFLSEISMLLTTNLVNRMQVVDASSNSHKFKSMTISMDVTMLHAPCSDIEVAVADSHGSSQVMLANNVIKKPVVTGKQEKSEGCRFTGTVEVEKVEGQVALKHVGNPDLFSLMEFLSLNASHEINHLHFGPIIPDMVNPLVNVNKIIKEDVALYKYFIKVVPTTYVYLYGSKVSTYQYSVTEHSRSPKGMGGQMILPGVVFAYEFSPIEIEYAETKPTILQFITSASAIIGGVFAVAGIIDRVVFKVSNKID